MAVSVRPRITSSPMEAAPAPTPNQEPLTPIVTQAPFMGAVQPIGAPIIQKDHELHIEMLPDGKVLTASGQSLTEWFHEDGSTSWLPTMLDGIYGIKPGFFRLSPDGANLQHADGRTISFREWEKRHGDTVTCPVMACREKLPVIPLVDNDALEALGLPRQEMAELRNDTVLSHMKWYHKQTFAQMLGSGAVSDEKAKNL